MRVKAVNFYDEAANFSPISAGNVQIRRKPDAMGALSVVSKTDYEIILQWSAFNSPENGDSEIITYNLYWDEGDGLDVDVSITDSLVTQYLINGLTGGETYTFKVRAQNVYGYGDYSSELAVKASDVPD